ncbi:hypothetical protein [Nakamurella sp. PAMC28650]|uniref:hypothetical protein n=1 Tax=Nakamurella sp. PAMC28650 TaxID=2762325 RepID=UPI00164D3A8E|nr:hypothetical protein [Nakamurella sp. PAMC28650]QNK82584.1 hypothetical protein H7F38_07720 [Nakamurella sp. PAMC28650]
MTIYDEEELDRQNTYVTKLFQDLIATTVAMKRVYLTPNENGAVHELDGYRNEFIADLVFVVGLAQNTVPLAIASIKRHGAYPTSEIEAFESLVTMLRKLEYGCENELNLARIKPPDITRKTIAESIIDVATAVGLVLGQTETPDLQLNAEINELLQTLRRAKTTVEGRLGSWNIVLRTFNLANTVDEIAKSAEIAREGANEASAAAITAKIAANEAGLDTIFRNYREIADDELKSAKYFRIAAIALFVLSVAGACWIVYSALGKGNDSVATDLTRLTVTIPLLALALYLAHEANGHRTVARRAREFQVRLQTVGAYSEFLSDDERLAIRAEVGRSVLTGPAMLGVGTESEFANSQQIIEKFIDVASNAKPKE